MGDELTRLYQCTLYDDLTDYCYADSRVYRTYEDAEKRARRMTYVDDGVHYGAFVGEVVGCWKEG